MNKILRFEITDKCNQRCGMCWSNDWKHEDMKWTDIEKTILEYAKKYPDGIIVLTSREPLLSLSFEKLLKLAKELNIDVKLLTNGTLLNDYFCKVIVNSSVNFISLSIHGSEEKHNKIVGSNNSYQLIISGLEKLNEYKKNFKRDDLDIRITTVINSDLLTEIDDIIAVAEKYNINLRIQHMMWHNKFIKNKHKDLIMKQFNYEDDIIDGFLDEVNINPINAINLIKKTKDKCDRLGIELQIYPDLNEKQIEKWYSEAVNVDSQNMYCDHVTESIRMRANGDITLCQYIDKFFGNIHDQNLNEILKSKEYSIIAKKLLNGELFPICLHCCHLRVHSQIRKEKNLKI